MENCKLFVTFDLGRRIKSILQAPGEAEAELAFLNRAGLIDAVISDDVDTFVFGATMVVRK